MADVTHNGQRSDTEALFRLDGRVAIVTGGSGLLAEQHALALTDAGASVVLADLRIERSQTLVARLEAGGRRALACECDVSQPDSWQRLLARTLETFGRIDVLVNNAAWTMQTPTASYAAGVADFPLEDWQKILDVNLTGTFLGCQTIGRHLIAQGSGAIINIASLYGVVSPNHRMYPGTGIHQPVAYGVSKGAVINLTRFLATAWGDTGVRVNCITPGGVENQHQPLFRERFAQLNPMGRMAQPDELRGALLYLASAASQYCTGHNLVVDGGWTVW
ncbi:MAG: SDR family oxidoreductase [Acidobacteria bacterium]|nr:SDR family oxidoreductase [Acidobacteriota bacterium]